VSKNRIEVVWNVNGYVKECYTAIIEDSQAEHIFVTLKEILEEEKLVESGQ